MAKSTKLGFAMKKAPLTPMAKTANIEFAMDYLPEANILCRNRIYMCHKNTFVL